GWVGAQAVIAALVVLVPTLGMGALFPVVVRAFREASREGMLPEKNVGRLYVLNTVGGIVGSLAAGFWLVPGMGMWKTVLLASGVSVALGILVWMAVREMALWPKTVLATTVAVVAVVGMWALPEWNALLLNQGLYREMRNVKRFDKRSKLEGQDLLFYREGVNTTVAILRSPGNISLRVSGKADASTYAVDLYTQLFVGQLPVMFARNPRHVAVIGFGSGMSAGTMLRHPSVESLDILEIERGVIEGSKYFELLNENPFDDPRTRLVLEDGRIHMTYTDKVYDAITSEPSNPWIAGVSNLFTADFYKLVRARLAPDGIFGQWIQLYELSPGTFKTMIRSLHEAFPYVAIFLSRSADAVVLASGVPIEIPWETLKERFYEEDVYEAFHELKIRNPLELFHFFFAGAEQVDKHIAICGMDVVEVEEERGEGETPLYHCPVHSTYTSDRPGECLIVPAINTDDNVWLEHRMPYDFFNVRAGDLGPELIRHFAKGRLAGLRRTVPGLPEEEAVRTMIRYVHSQEPKLMHGSRIIDLWQKWRGPIVEGFLNVFEEEGNTEMVEKVREWKKGSEDYMQDRVLATRHVVRAMEPKVQQQPSLREAFIEEALTRAPDLPFVMVMAGKFAMQDHDADKAEELFRRALEQPWSPSYYDAVMGLARVMERQKRLGEALDYTELAEESNPYFPNAFSYRAHLLNRMGKTDEALETLEQGFIYNPGDQILVDRRREIAGAGS
ncbi:MAG: hypothetical protein JSV08_06795, partial [Acidobacteriota bacterium]